MFDEGIAIMKKHNNEWETLEPCPRLKPQVSISLIKRYYTSTKHHGRAVAVLWLRRDVADWTTKKGPQFNVETSRSSEGLLRIVCDKSGRFMARNFNGGTKRMSLGCINFWPDEGRKQEAVKFWLKEDCLVLQLPTWFINPVRSDSHVAVLKQSRVGLGIHITRSEFETLETLLTSHVVAPAQLVPGEVSIAQLRNKILPLGISIETVSGGGIRLDATSKARLRALMTNCGKPGSQAA